MEQDRIAVCELSPFQRNLYSGIRDVRELIDELAVTSSDDSLPDTETWGNNSLEDVIADLKYTGNFTPRDIFYEDMSQILWAEYRGAPSIRPTTGAGD